MGVAEDCGKSRARGSHVRKHDGAKGPHEIAGAATMHSYAQTYVPNQLAQLERVQEAQNYGEGQTLMNGEPPAARKVGSTVGEE